MSIIYVPRSFGGTLLITIITQAPSTINVTWLTRDMFMTWKTRDDLISWKTRG